MAGDKNTEISDSDKKLNQIADSIGDAIKRFDSLDERMTNLEKSRGDRKDATEEKPNGEIEEGGEPMEPTADSKARKDAEEKEEAERADKARKDARRDAEEEEKMADKARRDARRDAEEKEEMEREDARRRDSAAEEERRHDSYISEIAGLKSELAALKPRSRSDSDRERFASIQEQAEPAFQAFSDRAPAPMDGETPLDYKRRLATKMQKHSDRWNDKRLSSISDEEILDNVVGDIYADSLSAARRGVAVAPGELREITTRSLAGHTRIEFQGDAASWMDSLAGDAMRGTGKFLTPS